MVNQHRVQRIKNLIYTVIVIVFLLPAIISIVLFLHMRTMEDALLEYVETQQRMEAKYTELLDTVAANKASTDTADSDITVDGSVVVPEPPTEEDNASPDEDDNAQESAEEQLPLPEPGGEEPEHAAGESTPKGSAPVDGNSSVGSVAPLSDNVTSPNPITGSTID